MIATRRPTQARAVQSRAALVEAAAVEFSAYGYAQTTTKSIAARAGVASGSYYQYFADKDAILSELAKERLDRIVAVTRSTLSGPPITRKNAQAKIAELIDLVVRYHAADPGLHAVLTERRHADKAIDAHFSSSEQLIVANIESTLLDGRAGGNVRATAFILFAMLEGAVHAHVLGQPFVSDTEFKQALTRALLRVAFD